MIDQTQLTALEQKTSQLLNALRSLRTKNESLNDEIERLRVQLGETTRELDLLRANTHLLTAVQKHNERLRNDRDKLRENLQRLLARISALRVGLED